MALPKLPAHFSCRCGAVHSCSIRQVVCGTHALASIPQLLCGYRTLTLVTDTNTAPLAGDALAKTLADAGFAVRRAHFAATGVLVPNEAAIAHILAVTDDSVQALVGVGSGVINDLCKYVAAEKHLPYLIAATASSMDGYASKGAAMILGGMKVTTDAAPPAWIVGDADLLATAPADMLRSGLGDLIGKYSCLNDWRLSTLVNGEPFCQDIHDRVLRDAEAAVRDAGAVLARQPDAVTRLFEGLVDVGVAMSFAGCSRPASGSEHHLSHFYEIVGLQRGFAYLPHGIDVAFGAWVTGCLRQLLCEQGLPAVRPAADPGGWRQRLQPVYGAMTPSVAALQQRTGLYDPAARARRIQAIYDNGPALLALLAQAPDSDAASAMLHAIGLQETLFAHTYGRGVIRESILWAKDLKDRYTLLNLLEDLGLLESFADRFLTERLDRLA